MDHFTFKNATVEDIPAVVSLVNAAYRGDESRRGWTTEADLLDGQRVDESTIAVADPASDVVLLLADSVVVGCFEYRREGANAAYLGMVTVSPLKQNSGLGRMLLEEAEARARKEGRTELYMTVIGTRSELIQWYQRRGFCVTTEFREFPAHDPRNGDPKVPVEALRMVVLRKIVGSEVGSQD